MQRLLLQGNQYLRKNVRNKGSKAMRDTVKKVIARWWLSQPEKHRANTHKTLIAGELL